MSKPTILENKSGAMVISDTNPFKGEIQKFFSARNKRSIVQEGLLSSKRITITLEENYFAGPFTRLYQNTDILLSLSPNACKLLIYIACKLAYNSERIHIPLKDTGLSKRTFSPAIIELMGHNILRKEKREWYWVNITLVIMGKTPLIN